MIYPLVRELAAYGVPVAVTCRVLKLARQPYDRWLASPATNAELLEAYRANALFAAHRDDPEFGYRFLLDEAGDAGEAMAARTAWRICSESGWWSVFGKKRGKNGKKPGPPVHDDLVRRDFTADSPNRLWLTDITEHPTMEGNLYLCAVKDVYSGRIVGYSIDIGPVEGWWRNIHRRFLPDERLLEEQLQLRRCLREGRLVEDVGELVTKQAARPPELVPACEAMDVEHGANLAVITRDSLHYPVQ